MDKTLIKKWKYSFMFKPKHVPIKLDISLGWFCKVTISTSRKSLSNFDVMQKKWQRKNKREKKYLHQIVQVFLFTFVSLIFMSK